jgi:hypothetical protein
MIESSGQIKRNAPLQAVARGIPLWAIVLPVLALLVLVGILTAGSGGSSSSNAAIHPPEEAPVEQAVETPPSAVLYTPVDEKVKAGTARDSDAGTVVPTSEDGDPGAAEPGKDAVEPGKDAVEPGKDAVEPAFEIEEDPSTARQSKNRRQKRQRKQKDSDPPPPTETKPDPVPDPKPKPDIESPIKDRAIEDW